VFPAREAVVMQQQSRGVRGVSADEVFMGNGVSELIDLVLRALLSTDDEVLVPSPDYPLWTAATILNDGVAVHYDCKPGDGFLPDPAAIEAKITPRTRALVIINPNNPTGAVYPRALLEQLVAIAKRHHLLLLADEIYDRITYDGAVFEPLAAIAGDVPCVSLGGLSKVHRACGWRTGWALLSGEATRLGNYHHAIDLLGALRLCSNVPGQFAVPAALEGPDTIGPLCSDGGRLYETRRAVIAACERSEHLSLVVPAGALYAFPAVVGDAADGFDDHRFALELLEVEGVLVVPGSSFNVGYRNHFRVTLLPEAGVIDEVFRRIDALLERYAQATRRQRIAVA
jgi:alanine-synthesizing transaminase